MSRESLHIYTLMPYFGIYSIFTANFVDQILKFSNRSFIDRPDGFAASLTFDCPIKAQSPVTNIEKRSANRAVALRFDVVEIMGHSAYYHK